MHRLTSTLPSPFAPQRSRGTLHVAAWLLFLWALCPHQASAQAFGDPTQSGSAQPPTQAEPSKAEPSKAEPSKAEPSKAEPSKAEPSKAEPSKAEPSKAEPSKTEPSKAEPQEEGEQVTREVSAERALESGRMPVRMRAPSRLGATGLAETLSADPGPQGTVRMSFHFGGFSSKDFLTPGVEERFLSARFGVAYTPHELVEIYASARSLSHTNPLSSPTTLQSQGDMTLGAKLGRFWGTLGGGLALDAQLYSAPEGGWDLSATSFNAHGLFTVDLTRGEQTAPFRFLFDLHYTLERSEALFEGLPELPSLVQEWGYQAAAYDRLALRFGLEVPTEHVSPFVEYHIATPFLVEMPRMGRFSNIFAFESVPHSLNLGVRGFVKERLSAELVGSLGLSDAPFTGVPATPPWSLWAGLSYTLDPRPEVIEREVKVKVTPPKPKPVEAKPLGALLTLTLVDKQSKAPIKGAEVRYLKRATNAPQLTDERGVVTGYRFTDPRLELEVRAEGYRPRRFALKIKPKQEELKGTVSLTPDPSAKPGRVEVSFGPLPTTPGESPEPAPDELASQRFVVALHGPEHHTATLTYQGEPVRLGLKPGAYSLTLSTPEGALRFHQSFTLSAGGELKRLITPADLASLTGGAEPSEASKKRSKKRSKKKRSKKPRSTRSTRSTRASSGGAWAKIDLKRGKLTPKRPLSFEGNSAKLTSKSAQVIKGFTKQLSAQRAIKGVTLSVYTHAVGSPTESKALGQKRGEAVRRVMSGAGFPASRVKIVSYGSSKNTASNLTNAGRKANQRVDVQLSTKE